MDERWEVQYTYPRWLVWVRFPAKYVSEEVARLAIAPDDWSKMLAEHGKPVEAEVRLHPREE